MKIANHEGAKEEKVCCLSPNLENKKIISEKKIRFDATNEALEVTEEDDGKKKKKGARRKKKDKEEDKMR